MPGNLPDVSQRFDADGSGYSATIRGMIKDNQALVASIKDVQRQIKELAADLGALDGKRIRVEVTGVDDAIGKVAALKKELGSLGDTHANMGMFGPAGAAQVRDYGRAMDEYAAAAKEAAARNAELNAVQAGTERLGRDGADALRSLTEEYRRYGETSAQARQAQALFRDGLVDQANSSTDAVVAMSEHEQAVARLAATYGTAREAFAKADFSKPLQYTIADMEKLRQSLRDTAVDAQGVTRFAPGGGSGGPLTSLAGVGLGGGGGGFLTAADYADKMMPFIKRWAGIAHYAIMGVNEALATILPATVAAGAATLVGWQGVEQMIPRVQAINATAESIGPAYGISSGQYLGTGNAIQKYQNLATGGVYELGGAGINLMRMGAGSFGQMGLSTIAMLDRGFADMQVNMAQRGTMGVLSSALGGGTDYLRQFGDVGANLGDIFLGMAPHLPGLGGDYLSALEGITGGLAGGIGLLNTKRPLGIPLGDTLGLGLAAEAGWRVGTPMLGLASRAIGGIGRLAGRVPLLSRRFGGLTGTDLAAVAGETGVDLGPLSLEAGGTSIAGLIGGTADVLGALTGPEVAALAGGAFLGSKLYSSMPSQAQRQVAALQAGIGQSGFSAAFTPLGKAIVTTQGLRSQAAGGSLLAQEQQVETPYEIGKFGPTVNPTYAQTYAAAATGFSQTTADLVNAGPQLVSALQKAGLKGVSMADAFQIAQNALLDTTHAFGKNGKLNQTALTMLSNYGAAIKPMTQSAGGFNAMIAAQQIMGSPAMKDLATVNQQADSMTQIMSGGPAGMAALFGLLGGSPTTVKKSSGIQLSAPPAFKKMAQALTSFTTTSGAGAWNAFAGSSGLVAAEQQNLDQLRTYMTLGALPLQGKTGAQGIAGFQLEQMLPLASKSPAALAMLMQQGAQMGVGSYYDPSKSFKDNLKAAEQSFTSMAGSAKQVNQGMNNAVIASSNLPATAAQFSQGVKADIQSQRAAAAATDIGKLKAGGMGSLGDLVSQYKASGYTGAALQAAIKASLQQGGITGGTLSKIMAHVQVQADTSQARAAIANLTHITNQPKVNVKADVAAAQAAINAIKGKDVPVAVRAQGIAAIQAAIDAIHGKTVTITTINRLITQVIGMGTPAGGVAPATLVGGGLQHITRNQTGRRLPGYGGGDILPILAEPGEVILPKHAGNDPMTLALGAKYRIPGFAAGGFVGQQAYGPLSYWGSGSQMAMWNPAMYAQILAAMEASQGTGVFARPQGRMLMPLPGGTLGSAGGGNQPYAWGTPVPGATDLHGMAPAVQKIMGELIREIGKSGIGQEFSVSVVDGIKKAITTGAAASALKGTAQALVAKLQQEVSYAKSTATSMQQGLNLGGMNLDPATGNGPVQTQMQSYAGSMQAFLGDLKKVRAGHLNKDLISQMVAAGPVQGDALAQSIMGGPGGIRAANQLDNQIGKLSRAIGAQAAMAQYGGHLSPDLRNATVVGKGGVAVNISVNAGKSGSLDLTKEQIAAIVAQVQAALLKQAKRNTRTGIKLPVKSS